MKSTMWGWRRLAISSASFCSSLSIWGGWGWGEGGSEGALSRRMRASRSSKIAPPATFAPGTTQQHHPAHTSTQSRTSTQTAQPKGPPGQPRPAQPPHLVVHSLQLPVGGHLELLDGHLGLVHAPQPHLAKRTVAQLPAGQAAQAAQAGHGGGRGAAAPRCGELARTGAACLQPPAAASSPSSTQQPQQHPAAAPSSSPQQQPQQHSAQQQPQQRPAAPRAPDLGDAREVHYPAPQVHPPLPEGLALARHQQQRRLSLLRAQLLPLLPLPARSSGCCRGGGGGGGGVACGVGRLAAGRERCAVAAGVGQGLGAGGGGGEREGGLAEQAGDGLRGWSGGRGGPLWAGRWRWSASPLPRPLLHCARPAAGASKGRPGARRAPAAAAHTADGAQALGQPDLRLCRRKAQCGLWPELDAARAACADHHVAAA
jgi:hypothetical protein